MRLTLDLINYTVLSGLIAAFIRTVHYQNNFQGLNFVKSIVIAPIDFYLSYSLDKKFVFFVYFLLLFIFVQLWPFVISTCIMVVCAAGLIKIDSIQFK